VVDSSCVGSNKLVEKVSFTGTNEATLPFLADLHESSEVFLAVGKTLPEIFEREIDQRTRRALYYRSE